MASEAHRVELADIDDLYALVEEVRRSRQPQILRRDGEDVAVLAPTPERRGTRSTVKRLSTPTPEQVERSRAGILAATGSWRDVDAEALKNDLGRQRNLATRPRIEL